ncbi:MAG: GTPase ObgE [Candidatus Pacebacteria bacterium]|nr:GTPase ObgE [Candidatus Paceibacterota bacterium]
MAFIDEITFHAKAGNGGTGVVRWRHEKGKEYAGAAGGNGGPGGDVYVRAVRDINILARHRSVKQFRATDGNAGENWSRQGSAGEDIYVELPIGSMIKNTQSGREVELIEDGQVSKILHGGRGGLGNEHFKASTNVKPEQSTDGMIGEEADFTVELNLIADAGFIGLPNAGKSSLLNVLTRANAKVGSYAFTTLDPNLGALHGYVLADIPGLIEGASEGKGLGHKFLKHVKRTKALFHLVSLENPADKIEEVYATIRKELEKYGQGLTDKKEVIILTKTDLVDAEAVKVARKALEKYGKEILEVSILDDASVKKIGEEIVTRLQG